jgi:hypothetical protein
MFSWQGHMGHSVTQFGTRWRRKEGFSTAQSTITYAVFHIHTDCGDQNGIMIENIERKKCVTGERI